MGEADQFYLHLHRQMINYATIGIQKVLDGLNTEHNCLGLSQSDLTDILIDLGATSLEDIETNGWQNDYFETWQYNNNSYRLAGTGYYGTANFARAEE